MNRRKSKTKTKSRSGKTRTPLEGHSREGKVLSSQFATLPSLKLASWTNERLPEVLWVLLLRCSRDQGEAIGEFHRILNFISRHHEKEALADLSHTGIAGLHGPLQEELISQIVSVPSIAASLAPLRHFRRLPARDVWLRNLPDISCDWEALMSAVGRTLWHQSQEATDCRWFRVSTGIAAGKMHIPPTMLDEWGKYPYAGDQRKVRPTIRAAEGALSGLPEVNSVWPEQFWDDCWESTSCFRVTSDLSLLLDETITRQRVSEVQRNLFTHWSGTHSTTAIDPRHDAIFGLAFYALRLLRELFGIGLSTSALGRMALRSLFEVFATMAYLLREDKTELWKKWRAYGAGQAKLAALKFDSTVDPPKYLSVDSIEKIAGEDLWEEFVNIDLGSWSGLDLRRLCEKADLKTEYDQYYGWTSGFVHGTWGPVRESTFATCGNPLHRLHRYPEEGSLPDVLTDACSLTDRVLACLDQAYPGFHDRLTIAHTSAPPGPP